MTRKVYKYIYPVIVGLLLMTMVTACGENENEGELDVDPPLLESSNPEDGQVNVPIEDLSIVLTFDQNVFCPSSGHSSITCGDATILDVWANLKEVNIEVSGLLKGKSYELHVPKGTIVGPTQVSAFEISLYFETEVMVEVGITEDLSVENPSQQAQNLYSFLIENYGENTLSGTMANVNWNINEAEWVKLQTGKYPAIATFDYVHLQSSPANWIDYSDVSIQEDWWNNNGIISAGWHWIVPTYEGSSDYTYKTGETTFKTSNATQDGTWENNVLKADLEKIAGYLKLLQQKNIPVIWRPLHEAAGNIYMYNNGTAWFWWGADGAEAYKKLWIYMFDYFESQGLNNMIWVWTTQTNDKEFYPGDNYVDIVGRDVYNNLDADDMASEFSSIQLKYPTKMITLSECGNVANISNQWEEGAQWSFFMPWYDYERTNDVTEADFSQTDHEHANAAWWNDALDQSYVMSRDEMPSLK